MNRLFTLLIIVVLAVGAIGQPQPRVSLLTFHAGEDIYELEGHSALRISMPDGRDVAISYGMFDFQSPRFVYRFVKGETDYWCAALPFDLFLNSYQRQGRRVVEQQIALDSVQTQRLLEAVDTNLLPQNRVYRYNYVLDNCATRPLAAIEAGLGDTVRFDNYAVTEPTTFRREMRRYHHNYPWYQFGIDMVLGSALDRPITVRERGFAPETLEQMMAVATTAEGQKVVCQTAVLNEGDGETAVLPPTPWYVTPLFVFWVLFAIALIITIIHKPCLCRWCDAVLFGAIGLAGSLITFLMCISVHYAVTPNVMIVIFNPLALLVPILTWSVRGRQWLGLYYVFYLLCAAALCVILIFEIGEVGQQSLNWAILPILLAACLRAIDNIMTIKK